jgi:hypothetical protein
MIQPLPANEHGPAHRYLRHQFTKTWMRYVAQMELTEQMFAGKRHGDHHVGAGMGIAHRPGSRYGSTACAAMKHAQNRVRLRA